MNHPILRRPSSWLVLASLLVGGPACGNEPGSDADTGETSTDPTDGPMNTSPSSTASSGPSSGSGGPGPDSDATNDDTGAESDDGSGLEPPPGALVVETFTGSDAAPWPAPWTPGGSHVLEHALVGNQGRLSGDVMEVARMLLPGYSATDIEATITVTFDDAPTQGFGLYVRQNGGYLLETAPPGQGYAAFVEGDGTSEIGIWRERDGVEELLLNAALPEPLVSGVPYRMRFQCLTDGATTRLRARIWPLSDPEPMVWFADHIDDTPQLQGTAGSFALDLYNYSTPSAARVDDFFVEEI